MDSKDNVPPLGKPGAGPDPRTLQHFLQVVMYFTLPLGLVHCCQYRDMINVLLKSCKFNIDKII